MHISPASRKLMLSFHIAASLGWAGALVVFLAHALGSIWAADPATARALAAGMGLAAWTVVLPLSIASFASGVFQALLTPWGLARHHWVLFKLALTAVATVVLLMKLGPISALARAGGALAADDGSLVLRASLAVHSVGGLAILLGATLLAVFKPTGLTRVGAERLGAEQRPTPAWARAGWTAAAVVVVALVAMALIGQHGPGAHLGH